ncbi:MAG: hypothetical protein PVF43_05130 [Candidatus Eiseniibacteriota bacterium]|jgi:hypothetical protein
MNRAHGIKTAAMMTALTMAMTFTGCGNDREISVAAPNLPSGNDDDPNAPMADFSGAWEITESWDGCAGEQWGYVIRIDQHGSRVTINGDEVDAIVQGELLTWEESEHSGQEYVSRTVTIWKADASSLRGVGSGIIASGGTECTFNVELAGRSLTSHGVGVAGGISNLDGQFGGILVDD